MPSSQRTLLSELEEQEEALRRRFRVTAATVPLESTSVELLRPADPNALITEEDYVRDERLPYWADLWPSSIVLAKYMEKQPGNGRRLLELGCGLGLVATAASRAGFLVTATDYYEDALEFTAVNVGRNAGASPTVRMVDWRALPDDLGTFDTIVAADVLYEARYPALVAGVLAHALARGGEALIADPGRVAAPEFLPRCTERGLEVTHRVSVPFSEGEIRQTIDIVSVGWASGA